MIGIKGNSKMQQGRFNGHNPCPNCSSGQHIAKGNGESCWGISYEKYFICTREELSPNCKELDTGYLHYYLDCFCGKSHGLEPTKNINKARPKGLSKNPNRKFAEQIWAEGIDILGTSASDYLYNRGIET